MDYKALPYIKFFILMIFHSVYTLTTLSKIMSSPKPRYIFVFKLILINAIVFEDLIHIILYELY